MNTHGHRATGSPTCTAPRPDTGTQTEDPVDKDIRALVGSPRRGHGRFHTLLGMDNAFLELLRCPIDPAREATLSRERDQLVCSRCSVRYPVKNGLPILIADEAELPPYCRTRQALPCQPRR